MKLPFSTSAIKKLFFSSPKLDTSTVPQGVVEVLGAEIVRGWVFHPQGLPLTLQLQLGDEALDLEPRWTDRQDVAAIHGAKAIKSGFVFEVDIANRRRLASAFDEDVAVNVLVNDEVVLPFTGESRKGDREDPIDKSAPDRVTVRNIIAKTTGEAEAPSERIEPQYFFSSPKLDTSTVPQGVVEVLGAEIIRGWVFHPQGLPLTLQLELGGEALDLEPRWTDRQDVAAIHGAKAIKSGFVFEVDIVNRRRLASAFDEDVAVNVLVNDEVVLPFTGESRKGDRKDPIDKSAPDRVTVRNIIVKNEDLHSCVEIFDHFSLRGWASIQGAAPKTLVVSVSGKELATDVLWRDRKDVADRFEIASSRIGFEIDLPGYVWQAASPDASLEVSLLADGQLLTPQALTLTRTQAADWIDDIAGLPDGKERQYRALQALEHVYFGSLQRAISPETLSWLQEFAEKMQLGDLVAVGETTGVTDAPSERIETLLLWKALEALNMRLAGRDQFVFDHVKAVAKRLRCEVREKFLEAVTPMLCSTGEFLRLRELTNFERLRQLGNDDGNHITLALPAIVVDGDVGRATDIMYRVVKGLDKGWLNTECIKYSMQVSLQMEAAGEVEIAVAEKFRYAVMALLDGLKGDWYSRLSDHSLIECMLLILSDIDRFTDYHRRDVVATALRIYGLNPTFWERAEGRGLPGLDSELWRGHAHFQKIHQAFTGERRSLVNWLEAISEPLAYFRAKNNPDAVIFLREICANNLAEINDSISVRAKALLAKLLASDPSEAIRVAAFPLPKDNRLLEAFPETMPEKLRETIRSLSHPDKSVAWHLQENASKALNGLLSPDLGKDRSALNRALTEFERRAIALANRQGGFLAFDMLASAYVVATRHRVDGSQLLSRMLGLLRQSIDETKADWYLPPPILAALNRMGNVSPHGDPLLRGFVSESLTMIRAKFGKRMDKVLHPTTEPKIELGQFGAPTDTLVVVYSCRKYLESRIQAIRETWIQDLKSRGIPYVILVGDGDDTLQGDLLALDVSDRYEDLPKKSLKLFDWVYKNTDAQYVLKIDDDCYLNASRFFDTLSYRKHNYYGRVIERCVGSMDRAWHQSKSHTDHGRLTIDKSPEPSIYADGGGAYTLSRLAMSKLLEAAQSVQGERLIAVSFMEDKLVGDLLALSNFIPSNEDYDSYQRRRTFGGAMPVGMWENTFFPCLSSPTKMTHLDNHVDLALTRAKAGCKDLWPKKIWPTCSSPQIKFNGNQLELLTDLNKMADLLRHPLVVICVVRNEIIMLPHFLAHYRALGVKCFVMVDNCSDDGTREFLHRQPDVITYSSDTEYKHSHYGVAWQQAVLGNHCLGKWALLADADELLIYDQWESKPLEILVNEIGDEGCNAAATFMIDMYPFGDLEEANFNEHQPFAVAPWYDSPPLIKWHLGSGKYSNGSTCLSAVRHRLTEHAPPNSFTSQKYGLIRYQPWIRYSEGLHDAANLKVSSRSTWFAHFKYHAGFKEKVQTEIRRGQHFDNAAEYRRYSTILAEGQGNFGKEGVSRRLTEKDHCAAAFGMDAS